MFKREVSFKFPDGSRENGVVYYRTEAEFATFIGKLLKDKGANGFSTQSTTSLHARR